MIVTVLLLVALILALVHELRAQGRDILGWAVAIVCVALLLGRLT